MSFQTFCLGPYAVKILHVKNSIIKYENHFAENPNMDYQDAIIDSEEEFPDDQTNALEAVSAEVSIPTAPIPLTHVSNSSSGTGPGNTSKAEASTPFIISSSQVGSSSNPDFRFPSYLKIPKRSENISLVHHSVLYVMETIKKELYGII
ncbi:unnamed protein product [Rhizophagus irregularis]|nr:unnamed protein product [Rhizophagus irregularis]